MSRPLISPDSFRASAAHIMSTHYDRRIATRDSVLICLLVALITFTLSEDILCHHNIFAVHIFPQADKRWHSGIAAHNLENKPGLVASGHRSGSVVNTSNDDRINYFGLNWLIWRPFNNFRIGRFFHAKIDLKFFCIALHNGEPNSIGQPFKINTLSGLSPSPLLHWIGFGAKIPLPLERFPKYVFSPLREIGSSPNPYSSSWQPPRVFQDYRKIRGQPPSWKVTGATTEE
jgi:hypothetical protein